MRISYMKSIGTNVTFILIGICIIGIWRGAWMLMDTYLGETERSAWISLGVGTLLLLEIQGDMIFT